MLSGGLGGGFGWTLLLMCGAGGGVFYAYRERGFSPAALAAGVAAGAVAAAALALEALGWLLSGGLWSLLLIVMVSGGGVYAARQRGCGTEWGSPTCSRPPTAARPGSRRSATAASAASAPTAATATPTTTARCSAAS